MMMTKEIACQILGINLEPSIEDVRKSFCKQFLEWFSIHDNIWKGDNDETYETIWIKNIETINNQAEKNLNSYLMAYNFFLIESDYFSEEEKNRFSKEDEKILNSEEFKKFHNIKQENYVITEHKKKEDLNWRINSTKNNINYSIVDSISEQKKQTIIKCLEELNIPIEQYKRCLFSLEHETPIETLKRLSIHDSKCRFDLFDYFKHNIILEKDKYLKIVWFKVFNDNFVLNNQIKTYSKTQSKYPFNNRNSSRIFKPPANSPDAINNKTVQIIGTCAFIIFLLVILSIIIYFFSNKQKPKK